MKGIISELCSLGIIVQKINTSLYSYEALHTINYNE